MSAELNVKHVRQGEVDIFVTRSDALILVCKEGIYIGKFRDLEKEGESVSWGNLQKVTNFEELEKFLREAECHCLEIDCERYKAQGKSCWEIARDTWKLLKDDRK